MTFEGEGRMQVRRMEDDGEFATVWWFSVPESGVPPKKGLLSVKFILLNFTLFTKDIKVK